VLLQRYWARLTEVSDRALGEAATDTVDMQLLVHPPTAPRGQPVGAGVRPPPAAQHGARGLARLLDAGLVERRTHPVDRRRAELHLTSRARAGVTHFKGALSDFFREGEQLERLQAAGLVVREAGALDSDRRAVVVHLTTKGRRVARAQPEVFRRHQEALLDAVIPATVSA
jgi:DNA-binding MarR family transcriptional regulator